MIDLRLIKGLSKTIKVTINDIVLSAVSTSLNKMFKEKNDKSKDF